MEKDLKKGYVQMSHFFKNNLRNQIFLLSKLYATINLILSAWAPIFNLEKLMGQDFWRLDELISVGLCHIFSKKDVAVSLNSPKNHLKSFALKFRN